MSLHFTEKNCTKCGKAFKTSNGSDECYDCTLKDLTKGTSPQEGEFNTAAITSGTMSAEERRYLQQDLEQVEVCGDDYYDEEEEDDHEEQMDPEGEWDQVTENEIYGDCFLCDFKERETLSPEGRQATVARLKQKHLEQHPDCEMARGGQIRIDQRDIE
jgi:hypothetical protein